MSVVKRISDDEYNLIDFLRTNSDYLNRITSQYNKNQNIMLLSGREDDVIERMLYIYKMLYHGSPQFFNDINEKLINLSLKVIKRLMGDNASFEELNTLIHNSNGIGRKMILIFSRTETSTEIEARENADIASWFLNEYFNQKSKIFDVCSSFRMLVFNMNSNIGIGKIFNPSSNEKDKNDLKSKTMKFVKLVNKLGKSENIESINKFSNEERMIVLDKILNKNNVAIIGHAGVGKTVLTHEVSQELKGEFEIMFIEATPQSNDNKIFEIKDFIDLSTNKPKLLVIDDVSSLNMVANIDYALKNNLQILIVTQGYCLSESWKKDLIDLYYPKAMAQSNLLSTTAFEEIFIGQNRKIILP